MKCNAFLPRMGKLPGIAGYCCHDCKKEVTVELD
jgi:hypothetical protein